MADTTTNRGRGFSACWYAMMLGIAISSCVSFFGYEKVMEESDPAKCDYTVTLGHGGTAEAKDDANNDNQHKAHPMLLPQTKGCSYKQHAIESYKMGLTDSAAGALTATDPQAKELTKLDDMGLKNREECTRDCTQLTTGLTISGSNEAAAVATFKAAMTNCENVLWNTCDDKGGHARTHAETNAMHIGERCFYFPFLFRETDTQETELRNMEENTKTLRDFAQVLGIIAALYIGLVHIGHFKMGMFFYAADDFRETKEYEDREATPYVVSSVITWMLIAAVVFIQMYQTALQASIHCVGMHEDFLDNTNLEADDCVSTCAPR